MSRISPSSSVPPQAVVCVCSSSSRSNRLVIASLCVTMRRRLLTALFCVLLLCADGIRSETLQCEERHITDGLDLEGTPSKTCRRESERQNLTSLDCKVWDYTDDDCQNLFFVDSGGYFSDVQIHPHTVGMNPNLKITFSNIKWHYLRFRQQMGKERSCQRLELQPSVQLRPELQLSFACNVWGSWADGRELTVLLDAGDSPAHITAHAHFLLRLLLTDPSESDITNWVIMVVVDVAHKPNLVVHWPAVPDKFGVTRYNVQVEDSEAKQPVQQVDSACRSAYCSLDLYMGYASRKVKVLVQPVHGNCTGKLCRSASPEIMLEFSFPVYFMLLIALAFVLFFTMIVCCVYFFCCSVPKDPPVLLILYDATELQHCRVVRKLAEYLKDVANIQCCIADTDVPLTDSKNPSTWLREKFGECSAVLVVASPAMHPDKRYSIYPNVLNEALPLIESHRGCPKHATSCGRYLVAVPSYCTAADIPQGLEDLPRVRLPQQLGFLVWSVYNQHCWWPLLVCMVKIYLLSCWCPGPMSAYKKYGDQLAEAIRVAEATQTVVETAPLTPRSSKYTQWTLMNRQKYEIDNESMPYKEYPGNLNDYSLLGGSIVSEEIAAPKGAHSIDHLSL